MSGDEGDNRLAEAQEPIWKEWAVASQRRVKVLEDWQRKACLVLAWEDDDLRERLLTEAGVCVHCGRLPCACPSAQCPECKDTVLKREMVVLDFGSDRPPYRRVFCLSCASRLVIS
jgi:hypothetical protein